MHTINAQLPTRQRNSTLSRATSNSLWSARKPQRRSRTRRIDKSQRLDISNLDLLPIQIGAVIERKDLAVKYAELLVEYVAIKDPSVYEWEFNEDATINDLLSRLMSFVTNTVNVDYIQVFDYSINSNEEELELVLHKVVLYADTFYGIPIRKVIELRKKHPTLMTSILSMLSESGIPNIFDESIGYHSYHWEFILEQYEEDCTEAYVKGEEVPINDSIEFFKNQKHNYYDWYNRHWEFTLKRSKPRIPLHKKLKAHILKGATINWHAIYQVGFPYDEDAYYDYTACYGIVDSLESPFSNSCLEHLNTMAYSGASTQITMSAVVKNNNVEDFTVGLEKDINDVNTYLIQLVNLLEKL